jgi:hypothetical protein
MRLPEQIPTKFPTNIPTNFPSDGAPYAHSPSQIQVTQRGREGGRESE